MISFHFLISDVTQIADILPYLSPRERHVNAGGRSIASRELTFVDDQYAAYFSSRRRVSTSARYAPTIA